MVLAILEATHWLCFFEKAMLWRVSNSSPIRIFGFWRGISGTVRCLISHFLPSSPKPLFTLSVLRRLVRASSNRLFIMRTISRVYSHLYKRWTSMGTRKPSFLHQPRSMEPYNICRWTKRIPSHPSIPMAKPN